MATVIRAIVMLVVLVGLPSAWVYHGPLPPAAMGVIQRTVATAKLSLGWDETIARSAWTKEIPKTAPRFDASLSQSPRRLLQPTVGVPTPLPPRQMTRDTHFSLASAQVPVAGTVEEPAAPIKVGDELARQLEPHLSLLRSLDAAEYTLENWGGEGQFYRFRCAVALGGSDDHTRQFEAVDADPLRAVHQVVGEVTSWQNARRTSGGPLWR